MFTKATRKTARFPGVFQSPGIAVGICTFPLAGYNNFSVVTGPFFMLASILSVMRQTGRLRLEYEVPICVVALGALMLIARSPAIPIPDWIEKSDKDEPTASDRAVR